MNPPPHDVRKRDRRNIVDTSVWEEKKDESDTYNAIHQYVPSPPCQKLDLHQQSYAKKALAPSSHPMPKNGRNSQQDSPAFLIFCAAGICSCYLAHGIMQEYLYTPDSASFLQHTGSIKTFLLVLGMIMNVFVAQSWIWIESKFLQKQKIDEVQNYVHVRDEKKAATVLSLNHRLFLLTAFFYVAAMRASTESLQYVSYPSLLLAKSSKLIPIMIMGLLVEKKSFLLGEWLGATSITAGIVVFITSSIMSRVGSDSSTDRNSVYGVGILVFGLFMDGLLGSCQGLLKRKGRYRCPSAMETMLFLHIYAIFFLLPLCVYNGEFRNGIELITTGPNAMLAARQIAMLHIFDAGGQIFISFTVHFYSPLMCTTITTARKFFTILLSVRQFGHDFGFVQWISICLVFGGIYSEIAAKNMAERNAKRN